MLQGASVDREGQCRVDNFQFLLGCFISPQS